MSVKSIGRDALVKAIEAGEQIPDHLLPVGIHRSSTYKWRAHLCTGGKKFSGPPRDTVREAVEDRRRLCEETGVEFVLYGKQTHARAENRPPGWSEAQSIQFAPDSGFVTSRVKTRPQTQDGRLEPRAAPKPPSQPIVDPTVAIALLSAEKRLRTALHPSQLLLTGNSRLPKLADRELCSVRLEVELGGISISDRFVWPVLTEDPLGLEAYLCTVLIDHNLKPSTTGIMKLLEATTAQLDLLRSAVLSDEPNVETRSTRHNNEAVGDRRKLRLARVELCDAGAVLETLHWDAYTPDSLVCEFCKVVAAERSIASPEWLLWQMLDQLVRHRQQLANKIRSNK